MEDEAPAPDDATRRRGLVVLAGLTAAVAAGRLVLALRAESLTSLPDEFGFLGDAWLLGRGEPAPPMGWAPFYKGAYPLLLAPVAALTDDTATLATAARVLNVGLLALLAPLVWVLLGRFGRLAPLPRAVTAVAATAVPGLWVFGVRAWPDALLAVVWVAALLALAGLLDPSAPMVRRLWFGPAVALLAATHDRFAPVALLAAALLVLRVLAPPTGPDDERPEPRAADVLNLGLALLVTAAGLALDARVARRWDDVADTALARLLDAPADTLTSMVGSFVGQLWYATAATFGLATVGAATLASVVWSHRGRPRALWTEPLPALSAMALVGTVAVQVGAALQIGDAGAYGDTPVFDLFANGRYQEVVLVPLVAVGVARLARRGHRSLRLEAGVGAAAVVLGGLTTLMLGTNPPLIDPGTAAGTTWLVEVWRDRPVVAPTLVALMVLAGFVLLRPPRTEVGPLRAAAVPLLALVALTVPGVDAARSVVDDSRARQRVPDLEEVRAEIGDEPVAFALDVATLPQATPVAWALAGVDLVTYAPGEGAVPVDRVIAPVAADGTPGVVGLDGWASVVDLGVRDLTGRPLHLWQPPST